MVPGQYYPFLSDSVAIETLRFYVSDICFMKEKQAVACAEEKAFLIEMDDPASCEIRTRINADLVYDQISFNIGIDSTANTAGALGGALDPTNGMYWTWQSGYIFIKLEGHTPVCTARNHFFQYHIGGYQYPYNSLQHKVFSLGPQHKITFLLGIDKLWNSIYPTELYEVMSPGTKAMDIAQKFGDAIYLLSSEAEIK